MTRMTTTAKRGGDNQVNDQVDGGTEGAGVDDNDDGVASNDGMHAPLPSLAGLQVSNGEGGQCCAKRTNRVGGGGWGHQ